MAVCCEHFVEPEVGCCEHFVEPEAGCFEHFVEPEAKERRYAAKRSVQFEGVHLNFPVTPR